MNRLLMIWDYDQHHDYVMYLFFILDYILFSYLSIFDLIWFYPTVRSLLHHTFIKIKPILMKIIMVKAVLMATILRNYSETSMISIPADKNNKAIILDVGGKKHKIRGEILISNNQWYGALRWIFNGEIFQYIFCQWLFLSLLNSYLRKKKFYVIFASFWWFMAIYSLNNPSVVLSTQFDWSQCKGKN